MEDIYVLHLLFIVSLWVTHKVSYKGAVEDTMVDTIVMLERGSLEYTYEEDSEGNASVFITIKGNYED
jgi:hypothetical protein